MSSKLAELLNWYDCFYNTPGSRGGTELSVREQETIWADKQQLCLSPVTQLHQELVANGSK